MGELSLAEIIAELLSTAELSLAGSHLQTLRHSRKNSHDQRSAPTGCIEARL